MKAISKLVEKLKQWANNQFMASKLLPRLNTLENIEHLSWEELDRQLDPEGKQDSDTVDKHLRRVALAQRTRTNLRVNELLDAFGPQIHALPAMLRSAIETSASKKPAEQALLQRFFGSLTDSEALESGIDMTVAMCVRDEDTHPVDPEIRALRLEAERVDAEMSKLRDASWYREELDAKRKRLAAMQEARAKRPEAEVQDTEMLRLIPHYLEQRLRLQELESKVAASPAFDAVDKALSELVVVASLAQWRDGSPGSLDGLLKVIYRHPSFTPLHNSIMADDTVDVRGLLAAVLNVHAVACDASPGVRFTLNPDNRVVGVWSLPGEVLTALFPAKKAESEDVGMTFDATK